MDPARSASEPKFGRLYLSATPVGNLEDVTLRVLRVLKEVSVVAAEDTRTTRKLFARYGIDTPLISYHDHNEESRAEMILDRLLVGDDVALVTDAGTPGLADPGYILVREAIRAGVTVVPLPGATALIPALVASGLPPHPFYFGAFLPRRRAERRAAIAALADLKATLVFYEAPHRLVATLRDLAEALPGRRGVVARELTKVHETFHRGLLDELVLHFERETPRGECVILVEGQADRGDPSPERPSEEKLRQSLLAAIDRGLTKKEAVKEVAAFFGIDRRSVYRVSIDLERSDLDPDRATE